MPKALSLFLAIAFVLARSASAAGVEGTYVLHEMETASTLELGPNHHFRWSLSQGAMDVSAKGNWEQNGETILLTTSPAAVPPQFELVGSSRDGKPGLLIKIVDVHDKPAAYLDVFADAMKGREPDHGFAQRGEYRFPTRSADPITSVRLGSEVFNFVSKPFPVVADGDNVMTFRFIPNDYSKANFAAEPAKLAGRVLTLKWRGVELAYQK